MVVKRTRALMSSVVVAVLLLAGAPAQADPRDDKKRADADVARVASLLEGATERAQQAAQRYAAASAALPGAQERVAEARGRVAAAKTRVNSARRAAEAARAEADRAAARYDESARRVDLAREKSGSFVSAEYKGSSIVSFNVLLGSRDLADAADRYGYFDRVMQIQREAIHELSVARRAAKDDQNAAESTRLAAERAEQATVEALAGTRAAERAATEAATLTARLVTARKDALAVANSERGATLARYRQAKVEEAKVEAELRAWEARNNNTGSSGGSGGGTVRPGARLLMPVRGWKSSNYGMRYDPYYHVWQLHAGVDLAAPGGTPIWAAAAGRVIRAGWNGGYGNYTCLSHGRYQGKSLTTCYGHQSRILVAPGQRVRAGQVIGRVGTTGASTGYHLHFEVRRNGSPIQPLNWLPSCLC
jgi:murein DD-endopeptidase MepM/ murein hydrolase activator NlpD